MTTTLNGNRAVTRQTPRGTMLVENGTGREARLDRWIDDHPESCYEVRFVTDGDLAHVCFAEPRFRLQTEITDEDVENDVMSSSDAQRIVDLIREKTQAEMALDSERTRYADAVTRYESAEARIVTLTQERDQANEALSNLWDALGAEADRREWCSEYDEFARRNGGPTRNVDDVEWSATVQVSVRAATLVSTEIEMSGISFPDTEWVPMRFTVGGTQDEVRRGRCICDTYRTREEAYEELSNNGIEYSGSASVISQSCDHDG